MSRRRVHAAEFIKLLESAAQPLYVLDDSLRIVFMNEACRAWLGEGADDLIGQTCVYDSGEKKSGLERMAAGLCPPPAVLEGWAFTAPVSYSATEQALFRRARFVPLSLAGGPVLCIVALVDAHDSPQTDIDAGPPGADESQELHLQLQRFRQQRILRIGAASVVGVTPAARRAAAQAELAAATRVNVLILGPPGSGRRRLAEAIHLSGYGGRKGESLLVPLECSLLDADLVQSTLRAAAAVATSDGGTLLLCDADRLPLEAQAAVAAALSPSSSPWRAIATAAAPLVELAPRGLIREDLAAMLSTITIELPPLSTRRDDVPLLAQALLGGAKRPGRKTARRFCARRAGPPQRLQLAGRRCRVGAGCGRKPRPRGRRTGRASGPARARSRCGRSGRPSASQGGADRAGRVHRPHRAQSWSAAPWPAAKETRPRPHGCWASTAHGSIGGCCSLG